MFFFAMLDKHCDYFSGVEVSYWFLVFVLHCLVGLFIFLHKHSENLELSLKKSVLLSFFWEFGLFPLIWNRLILASLRNRFCDYFFWWPQNLYRDLQREEVIFRIKAVLVCMASDIDVVKKMEKPSYNKGVKLEKRLEGSRRPFFDSLQRIKSCDNSENHLMTLGLIMLQAADSLELISPEKQEAFRGLFLGKVEDIKKVLLDSLIPLSNTYSK